MAVGRKETDQSTEPRAGYVSALQGRDGRFSPPPKGDIYIRDPEAARARAIRERVALHRRLGNPIPPYLQELYDRLPAAHKDVELVDAVSGEHVAEVGVITAGDRPKPDATPPPAALLGADGVVKDNLAEPLPEEPLTVEEVAEVEPAAQEPEAEEVEEAEEAQPVEVKSAEHSHGGTGTLSVEVTALPAPSQPEPPAAEPSAAPAAPRQPLPGRRPMKRSAQKRLP